MIRAQPSLLEWSATNAGSTPDESTATVDDGSFSPPTDVETFLQQYADTYRYYGSGKCALRDGLAAVCSPGQNVLVPAYLPDAVVEPLFELGLEPRRYAIYDTLAPVIPDLESRADDRTGAVVSVNYFGFPQPGLEAIAELAHDHDWVHVDDNAHGALSVDETHGLLGTVGDIGITSLWKTLPVGDGAVLYCNDPEIADTFDPSDLAGVADSITREDLAFVCKSIAGDLLDSTAVLNDAVQTLITSRSSQRESDPRGRYESTKAPMSRLSSFVLTRANPIEIVARRRANYLAWHALFHSRPDVTPVFDELPPGICPQVYPVRTAEASKLLGLLERYGIDGAHTWPRLATAVLEDEAYETAHRLAREIVVLPVHQHIDTDTIVAITNEIERSIGYCR
ncbi:DegT/DnrJ/EryC1/StrS family aminotransferase [Natronosalvus amylolyticus]|uniref:DegT/DnrJ/EryC1/StrS family aminotransferase n=1 Tax=Natronosalvus amylolyticus TaxID=2961994 RepID=UPI0020C9A73A|nr:DegT/DnrJ/EryC1/StrS family aminotransferase [Natronosalvus amylolyticus]